MIDNKTQQRYQTIVLHEQGLLSAEAAANSMGTSERQFFRVLSQFRKSGRKIESLKYQSHPAWNKTDKKVENKILKLNKDYPEALNSHLSWLAWDLYNLSVKSPTIRSILINNDKYVPYKDKKERAYKKFQSTHFGALVQLDTCDGFWLRGYGMLHLILAIDDATRTILAGGFYLHDSTLNNMLVIKELISKHGVPALFYTDCDSKFKVIRHGNSRHQKYQEKVLAGEAVTEIRRALTEVGSGLITATPFYPQGKGKIEKLIRFAQDCFVQHHRAKNLEELNRDFKRWLPWYDKKNHRGLGIAPKTARENLIAQGKSAFKPVPNNSDLDYIFSVRDERKPNKYNIFSYQGTEYQLPLDKVMYPGKVELRITPDNRIMVFSKEKELIAELKS